MTNLYIEKFIQNCPGNPGVYKFFDNLGEVIYVGKAKNLKNRIRSYLKFDELSHKLRALNSKVIKIEIIITENEAESFLLEANLIKKYKPRYNVLLKDDKSFPYIAIDKSEYPRILKFRGKNRKDLFLYGPFTSSQKVDQTIQLLQKIFLIRSCSDSFFASRKRPCLLYQIKRCSGPCVHKISQDKYIKSVQQIRDFLSGNVKKVRKEILNTMENYSDSMEYEKAADLRDKLKDLSLVESRQFIIVPGLSNADIISVIKQRDVAVVNITFVRAGYNLGCRNYVFKNANDKTDSELIENFIGNFYQNNMPPAKIYVSSKPSGIAVIENALSGLHKINVKILKPIRGRYIDQIKKSVDNASAYLRQIIHAEDHFAQVLKELEETFNTSHPVSKIEVYDNSHLMGKSCIGSRIVWSGGDFKKNEYKKYNLQNLIQTGGNDYEMLYQVLSRRFRDGEELENFFIIDGGIGHVSTVNKVLEELKINIDFICVSKGKDRNSGNEEIYDKFCKKYSLNKRSDLKKFIQKIRDEAHRFALSSHKVLRKKEMFATKLDLISGLGSKRKRSLLNHFGSLQKIKDASIPDLSRVEGISQKIAEKIYNFFRQ